MLFNFQSERILNETFYENVKLLSETDKEAQAFQEALATFQEKVISIYRSFGEWGIGFVFT